MSTAEPSTAERDPRLLRRAALRLALLKGDMLGTARAGDRLRISGAAVSPEEAGAARAAKVAVGHALRDARYRRDHDADRFGLHVVPDAAPVLRRSPTRVPRLALAVAGTLALVLLVLFLYQPVLPGGEPPTVARPSAAPVELAGGGRGRTTATLAPVVVVPQTAAPGSPAPIASPGTGAGGGVGDGGFSLLPRKSDQDYRIVFVVWDIGDGHAVKDVCVVFGTECVAGKRTNADGIAYFDFPLQGIAPKWNFDFVMAGYGAHREEVLYNAGAPQPLINVFIKRT